MLTTVSKRSATTVVRCCLAGLQEDSWLKFSTPLLLLGFALSSLGSFASSGATCRQVKHSFKVSEFKHAYSSSSSNKGLAIYLLRDECCEMVSVCLFISSVNPWCVYQKEKNHQHCWNFGTPFYPHHFIVRFFVVVVRSTGNRLPVTVVVPEKWEPEKAAGHFNKSCQMVD